MINEKHKKYIWLSSAIASIVAVLLFTLFAVMLGLRGKYVGVGIFTVLAIAAFWAVPFLFNAYIKYREKSDKEADGNQ